MTDFSSLKMSFAGAAFRLSQSLNLEGLTHTFERSVMETATFCGAQSLKALNYLRKNYPGKACGAICLPGSGAIAVQGTSTGDTSIVIAGITLVASNLALLLFSDLKNGHKKDPQDKKLSVWNPLDPVHHPHESSSAMESVSLVCLIYGGFNQSGGEQLGYALMGLTDVPGMLITSFVRERPVANDHRYKTSFLNLPGVHKAATFVQNHPLAASVPFYVAGDIGLYGYNLMKAGFNPAQVDSEFTTSFISYSLATFFLLFAKKRRMTANDNTPAVPTPIAAPTGP